jgi:hypothetical protein
MEDKDYINILKDGIINKDKKKVTESLDDVKFLQELENELFQEGIIKKELIDSGKIGAYGAAVGATVGTAIVGAREVIKSLMMSANKQYRKCAKAAFDASQKRIIKDFKDNPGFKGIVSKSAHLDQQYKTDLLKCKHAYEVKVQQIKEKKAELKAEFVKKRNEKTERMKNK